MTKTTKVSSAFFAPPSARRPSSWIPDAAWLDWQFLPTGKTLTLNNAQQFFTQLRQKYFIFACDNGDDEILFYTAFTHAASPQYTVQGYHFAVDYNVDQRRQYLWRDEN